MLRPNSLLLLLSLSVDGGTPPPVDGGTPPPGLERSAPDAGSSIPLPKPTPQGDAGIQWPKDLRPLATLDGPAVLAAHAALQRVLSRFPKDAAGACEYSAKSMDVVVGQEGGLYFVRIDRRADRCGWPRGAQLEFDWFELYAVSAEGQVIARYPYMP